MGHDVAVLAAINVRKGMLPQWDDTWVDPRAYRDWPEPLDPGAVPPQTAGAALSSLAAHALPGCFAIRRDDRMVQLACVLGGDGFSTRGAELAAAFRLATRVGGKARVAFVGFRTSGVGLRFDATPEGSELVLLREDERRTIERSQPFRWLEAAADGEIRELPALPASWLQRLAVSPAPTPPVGIDLVTRGSSPRGAFDAVVSGELRFPPGGARRWNQRPVTPADMGALGAAARQPISPRDLSHDLQRTSPSIASLRVQAATDTAWIRGALRAHELAYWGSQIIAAFQAAADDGAAGHLWLLPPGAASHRGRVLEITATGATMREPTDADLAAAAADARHTEAGHTEGAWLGATGAD